MTELKQTLFIALNEIMEKSESTNLFLGSICDSLERIEKTLKGGNTLEAIADGNTLEAIAGGTIEIDVEEFTRLKDIETRFEIIKKEMLTLEYCPLHTQIILGIESEYAQMHEIKTDLFPGALKE